ncbi:hypothetical protein MP228_009413 [Amoeboaphelidium protococcarum]|nr:hypothetical protein MP228_009413 [Amoeboaphelidium protococcarum]
MLYSLVFDKQFTSIVFAQLQSLNIKYSRPRYDNAVNDTDGCDMHQVTLNVDAIGLSKLKQRAQKQWDFNYKIEQTEQTVVQQSSDTYLNQLLPKRYEIFDNLVVFPQNWPGKQTFSTMLSDEPDQLQRHLLQTFKVSNLAIKGEIDTDDIRSPRLQWVMRDGVLRQDFNCSTRDFEEFWTSVTQNGIQYNWNPQRTMFCRGNITEKLRIAQMDSVFTPVNDRGDGDVILDLYAGIGYFTLPYLVHRKARFVYACEMNQYSILGLQKSLIHHKIPFSNWNSSDNDGSDENIDSRILILYCDNCEYLHVYRNKVDRVNLGLLPSSETGWPLAIEALKLRVNSAVDTDRPAIRWLHIHENVSDTEIDQWKVYVVSRIRQLLTERVQSERIDDTRLNVELFHLERVKSYSPRVHHYVADIRINM